MWTELDIEEQFLTGTVEGFLEKLTDSLEEEQISGLKCDDLELYNCQDSNKFKVYFIIDDREYHISESEETELTLKNFCKENKITYSDWDRVDAYPDGTASYVFYFNVPN